MNNKKDLDLSSNEAKVSYGLGWQFGRHLQTHNFEGLDMEAVVAGMYDCFGDKDSPITDAEVENAFKIISAQVEIERKQQADQYDVLCKKFLADNSIKPGIQTTPSGLQFKVNKEGTGEKPGQLANVVVHYHGSLIDGTVFDSSLFRGEPIEFPVQGVIPGWTEALQLMPEGSKWTLYIPAELAYGEEGKPPKIPRKAALVFDIELIKVV